MDGVLSQEEISALLSDDAGAADGGGNDLLTTDEIDAIGEISNISMGTAATTRTSRTVLRGGGPATPISCIPAASITTKPFSSRNIPGRSAARR